MEYWISDGFRQEGPYPIGELPGHGLTRDSLVWREGMPEWVRADSVPQLRAILEPPPRPEAVQPPAEPVQAPVRVSQAPRATQQAGGLHYHGPAPGAAAQTSSMAIASLICGVLALVFLAAFACAAFIPMSLAIILGHIAVGRIGRGEESGRGLAVAGMVLGYIVLGIHLLVMIVLGLIILVAAASA